MARPGGGGNGLDVVGVPIVAHARALGYSTSAAMASKGSSTSPTTTGARVPKRRPCPAGRSSVSALLRPHADLATGGRLASKDRRGGGDLFESEPLDSELTEEHLARVSGWMQSRVSVAKGPERVSEGRERTAKGNSEPGLPTERPGCRFGSQAVSRHRCVVLRGMVPASVGEPGGIAGVLAGSPK